MNRLASLYKLVVGSVTIPLVTRLLAFLDGKRWMPVFYFLLTQVNTNDMLLLQVLHNIRMKTGRKVFVITAWPIWPRDTVKDPFHRSFLKGIAPGLKFLWIPTWLHHTIKRYALLVLRLLLLREVLYRSLDINATLRYSDPSTIFETDILTQGDKTVMRIPGAHQPVLEARLRDLGVASGEWFVCVHARSNGWTSHQRAYGLQHHSGYTSEEDEHRNVDIRTYFPAIEYIISQGGKVIRMGDPSMEPIDGIPGLIDYPFSCHRSLPMDLYLVANCRFVIGCEAGFTTNFPVAFGAPLLVTNLTSTVVTSMWPYCDTRVMLKPVQELTSGRILGLRERSHPTLSTIHNSVKFKEMGYRWLANSAEEILEGTEEMLELVENGRFGAPMTVEQEYFDQCVKEALSILWPPGTVKRDSKWAHMKGYQSRVSATYASRHFRDQARQAEFSGRI